jgi:hypothetical protein
VLFCRLRDLQYKVLLRVAHNHSLKGQDRIQIDTESSIVKGWELVTEYGLCGPCTGGFRPWRGREQISDSEMKHHKYVTKVLAAWSAHRRLAVGRRLLLSVHWDMLGLWQCYRLREWIFPFVTTTAKEYHFWECNSICRLTPFFNFPIF